MNILRYLRSTYRRRDKEEKRRRRRKRGKKKGRKSVDSLTLLHSNPRGWLSKKAAPLSFILEASPGLGQP